LSLPGTIFTHFAIFLSVLPDAPTWLRHAVPFTLNIEMFFVLSGALITNLLVSEHRRTGSIGFRLFYLRRSRRLGPALLAVVPLLLLAHFFISGTGIAPLGVTPWVTALALLLFMGNWRLSDNETGLGWMGPSWTLGIEEQFYLTFPALLLLLLRRFSRRIGLATILLGAVAMTVVSAYLFRHLWFTRVNYMTPTHLPPLLLGCALGFHLATSPTSRFARALRSQLVALAGLGGMAVISISWGADRVALGSGAYALYGAFSCLLIGHLFVVASRPGIVSKALSWKPLVVIGQVSYEAYLVHCIVILAVLRAYPTMAFAKMMALDAALIAIISGAFYYFIGRPIRRQGWGVLVGRPMTRPPRATPPPVQQLAA
jgi:peptidoglycan/LPS O-acetylase OafA/YrhL